MSSPSVTAPEILVKQPSENRSYSISFDKLLGASETISTIVSVLSTPSGPTITGEVINGRQVDFRLSAGSEGKKYRIEAIVTTSDSNTLEGDGILLVRDT